MSGRLVTALAALGLSATSAAVRAEEPATPVTPVAIAHLDATSATHRAGDSGVAMDFDEPEPAASAISFGRGLDLQGTPIRLAIVRPGARSGAGLARNPSLGTLPVMGTPQGSPVRFASISSGFGSRWHPVYGGERFHAGVDMTAAIGTRVVATAPGIVSTAGSCGGYGLCVAVDHGGGVVTIYGHLSRIDVSAGARVGRGDEIGLVGSTGVSTGPHLHYEIRRGGQPLNPRPYL